jgi:hypothetical protein
MRCANHSHCSSKSSVKGTIAAPGVRSTAPIRRSVRQVVTRGVLVPEGSRQVKTTHFGPALFT